MDLVVSFNVDIRRFYSYTAYNLHVLDALLLVYSSFDPACEAIPPAMSP